MQAWLEQARSLDRLALLEELQRDQLQRWRNGQRVPAEAYLQVLAQAQAAPTEAGDEDAFDLIYGEFLCRRELGEEPTFEEYRWRFPDHAAKIRLLIELEEQLQLGAEEVDTIPSPEASVPPEGNTTLRSGDPAPVSAANHHPHIPGYEILGEIGRGGMGVIYRARQFGLNRLVALKVMRVPDAGVEAWERFRIEAEAVALLQHPNIVQIYEIGGLNGRSGHEPFMALELVEGGSLADALSGQCIPADSTAALIESLARAVHFAHQRGILHRDLKPANILLKKDEGGRMKDEQDRQKSDFILHPSAFILPKITDFGLAKMLGSGGGDHTMTGTILGTPAYMAPEQAEGRQADLGVGTDIYALGVILYELLCGEPPFRGPTALATLEQVRMQEPATPSRRAPVPRDLEVICLKCLSKEPEKRYASAAELAADLQRFRSGEPIQARPVGAVEWLLKWARRRPAVAALLASLVLALITGTAVASILWLRAEGLRAEADTKKRQAEDRLVGLRVATGVRVMDEGDLAGSLLWFVKALEEEHGGQEREALHRIRIACILSQYPRVGLLRSHAAAVNWATFSPDGSRVLSACSAGGASVWDVVSGRDVCPPLASGFVRFAAFCADGRRVVTAQDDRTARIWDVDTGRPVSPPMPHGDLVLRAAFSPDGGKVVTACRDHTAQVWDAWSGQPLSSAFRHDDQVRDVAFSPDGRWVVTAGYDATARVWDARSGQPVSPPLKHGTALRMATFSPDGRWVVTASEDYTARVWDAKSGQPVSPPLRHAAIVARAAFSPDGRWVVTASDDHTARVWDAKSGQALSPPMKHAGPVLDAAFSPYGRRIITASVDQTARVWDAVSGRPLSPPLKHAAAVRQAAFHPDGRHILTAGEDHCVRLWDLAGATPQHPAMKHPRDLHGAAFSPDGRLIATSGIDSRACVWVESEGRLLSPPVVHAAPIKGIAFSPDSRRLVTTSDDQTARVWDVATGQAVSPPLKHGDRVSSASFSSDGRWVATASEDHTAQVWDAVTGQAVSGPLKHSRPVKHTVFSSDSRRVVTMDWTDARMWDPVSGRLLLPSLEHGVTYGAFSPDGRRIVTLGDDFAARIWDAETGCLACPLLKHATRVRHVAFSPNGRWVVTASGDHTARVWDAESGQPVSAPLLHAGGVNEAAFSPDGRRVVTASQDQTARVWDVASGQPLTPPLKHSREVRYASFSADGSRVRTIAGDGTIRIWALSQDQHPLPDLTALTTLLSGHSMDEQGNETAADAELLAQVFGEIQAKYPEYAHATAAEVRAWHRDEAKASERASNWTETLFHLDQLMQQPSASKEFGWRRGRAYAALGQWEKALGEFKTDYADLPEVDEQVFGLHALVCAVVGDSEGERECCAAVLKRFTDSPTSANNTAWFCCRFPNRTPDLARVVEVAEKAWKAHPEDPTFYNTVGLAYYRAGRYADALRLLDLSVATSRGGSVYDWLFLAMTHQRLGHSEEARKWLKRATSWLDHEASESASGTAALRWDERAELRFFRKEAEDLVLLP